MGVAAQRAGVGVVAPCHGAATGVEAHASAEGAGSSQVLHVEAALGHVLCVPDGVHVVHASKDPAKRQGSVATATGASRLIFADASGSCS